MTDLHIHSTNSDGQLTVDEIVSSAKEKGFKAIAITDHDNIESWSILDGYTDIITIKGVELSTTHKNESVHILGYYLNNGGSTTNLELKLKELKEKREERVYKIIELLHQFNIYLTYEEIVKYADGVVARPHIALAIMNKYPKYSKQYIFDNFIGNDKPAYVPVDEFSTLDAINLLHENNCIAVLAHPLYIKKFNYKEILSLGIDGIECFYSYTDIEKKDIDAALRFGKNNNLIITGGSDYHGPDIRDTFGTSYIDNEYENIFFEVINKK